MVIDVLEQGSGAVKSGKGIRGTQSAVLKKVKNQRGIHSGSNTRTGTGVVFSKG